MEAIHSGLSRAERDLSDGFRRWRLRAMHHPVRGFMDASAAVVAAIATTWLWTRHDVTWSLRIGIALYGLGLVGVFAVSALYHSVPWTPARKEAMRRLDHTMIFLLVAGTFTPITLVVLDGWLRVVTLGLAWGIAAVGAAVKWCRDEVGLTCSIVLQLVQGWSALLVIVPVFRNLPGGAGWLVVTGGMLYTVATVLLVSRRPYLWPRVFSYHEVMHVFVIAAAACHYLAIARYVVTV